MSQHSPYWSYWSVDPSITFLNHGSLGPTPNIVLDVMAQASRRVSANPLGFMTRELESELEQVCIALGKWLKADPQDLVLTTNATMAMNAVANSLELNPGDEILLNDHEYGAVLRIFRERAARSGATTVVARLPATINDPEEVAQSIMNCVTSKTKMVVFSHVTSPTSLILPAQRLCELARQRGILTCIDGPHALASCPVNMQLLQCDFYVASCHKWLSAPCGTGFLYAKRKFQSRIFHPAISWGRSVSGLANSWKDSFTWPGTFDPAPFMALPKAIEFMEQTIGINTFREYSHKLARLAYSMLSEVTGLTGIYSQDSNWYGPMLTFPLPESLIAHPKMPAQKHQLQHLLQQQFQIEIPVIQFQGKPWIRVSTHLYNSEEDLLLLGQGLKTLLPALT